MFKHRVNGANNDRVNKASSACFAALTVRPCDQSIPPINIFLFSFRFFIFVKTNIGLELH